MDERMHTLALTLLMTLTLLTILTKCGASGGVEREYVHGSGYGQGQG